VTRQPPVAGKLRAAAVRAWRDRRAGWAGPPATALLCGCAGLLAGPVAVAVLAVYGAAAFVLIRGVAVRRSQQRAFRHAVDAVGGLAADLRAGLALATAWRAAEQTLGLARAAVLPGAAAGDAVATVADRVAAAMAVGEAAGAPLADVLDRLDAHLRAVDRARAVASSQAAGTRVSAGLLAAMPVAGVGLGILVGVDAWGVLLHTGLGALALSLAVVLQLSGLAWTARLARSEVPA
jgi:tight adherence protein B